MSGQHPGASVQGPGAKGQHPVASDQYPGAKEGTMCLGIYKASQKVSFSALRGFAVGGAYIISSGASENCQLLIANC